MEKEDAGKDIDKIVIKIKSQMNKKGMNARMLSTKAEVGRSFVYDVLNGKLINPSSKKFMAIINVLDISLSYLDNSESVKINDTSNLKKQLEENILNMIKNMSPEDLQDIMNFIDKKANEKKNGLNTRL